MEPHFHITAQTYINLHLYKNKTTTTTTTTTTAAAAAAATTTTTIVILLSLLYTLICHFLLTEITIGYSRME